MSRKKQPTKKSAKKQPDVKPDNQSQPDELPVPDYRAHSLTEIHGGQIGALNNYGSQTINFSGPRSEPDCPPMPHKPEHFGGRAKDLEVVATLVKQNPNTVVYGVSGLGKTTLAKMLAHHLKDEFQVVVWTNVGREVDVAGILEAWSKFAGDTQGFRQSSRSTQIQTAKARLTRAIATACPCQPSRVLVILDDVWDVATADDLCEAVPDDAHILITSLLDEIKIVRGAQGVRLGYLDRQEAADLLKQYDLLRQANDRLLEGLGDALGGHPLALTLAARRAINELENFSNASVITILETHTLQYSNELPESNVFTLLGKGEQRDKNLEKSLAYSYMALPDDLDRKRFKALGVLGDAPINLNLLSGLWGIPQDRVQVDGCLPLLKASLLSNTDTEGLYRIHPLLRTYASDLLLQEGERDGTYRDLLHYFRRAYPYAEDLKLAFQSLSSVAADFNHICQILNWGWIHEPRDASNLYFSIDLYLSIREDPALRLKLSREAQGASERCGYKLGIANALLTQGRIQLFEHNLREALKAFKAAQNGYIDIGDEIGLANACLGEADTYLSNFDVSSALPIYQDLEILFQRLKWPHGEARVLDGQARIHFINRDFTESTKFFIKLQAMYRDLGLDSYRLIACLGEADARRNNSELKDALAIYIDVQSHAKDIDYRFALAVALSREGQVRLDMNELDLALEKFRAAQKILTLLNASFELIHALKGEADTLLKQPSVKASLRAEELYRQIWDQYSRTGHIRGQISTLQQYEKMALMRRDFLQAGEFTAQANKLYETLPSDLTDNSVPQAPIEQAPMIKRPAPKRSPVEQDALPAISQWIEANYLDSSFQDSYMTGCEFIVRQAIDKTIGFRVIIDDPKRVDWQHHINFHVVNAYHDLHDHTYDTVGVICVARDVNVASMISKMVKNTNISSQLHFLIGIIEGPEGNRSFQLLERAETNFPRETRIRDDEG